MFAVPTIMIFSLGLFPRSLTISASDRWKKTFAVMKEKERQNFIQSIRSTLCLQVLSSWGGLLEKTNG